MSAVEAIVERTQQAERERMRREREIAEAVHREWALGLSNTLAAAIRLYEETERVGSRGPEGIPPKRWCLAAYTLLCFGSTPARHAFLVADEDGRNRLVAAVERDGFVVDDVGRMREILP